MAARTFPQSRSCEGGKEEEEEGQALTGFPAPARQRHSPFPAEAGDSLLPLTGSGQPRSLRQAPPHALRTVARAGEEASWACAQGASVVLPAVRGTSSRSPRCAPRDNVAESRTLKLRRLASTWLLRPVLQLARRKGVSELQVPAARQSCRKVGTRSALPCAQGLLSG